MKSRWETHLGGHPSFRGVGVPRRGTTRPRRHHYSRKSSGLPPPLHNVPTVFLNVNNGCRPCPCHVHPRALSFLFPLGDRRSAGIEKKTRENPALRSEPCRNQRPERGLFEKKKKKFLSEKQTVKWRAQRWPRGRRLALFVERRRVEGRPDGTRRNLKSRSLSLSLS